MRDITLNQQYFKREISFFRLDNPAGTGIVVEETSISQLVITNDLYEILPRLSLTVRDSEQHDLLQYAADGQSGIRVFINDIEQDIYFDHTFIIDNISPIHSNTNEMTLVITAVSYYMPVYLSSVEYSTTSNNLKSPVQIIQDILKSVKIPVKLQSGLPDSKEKIMYITPPNISVMSNIEWLLSRAVSPDTGIFAVPYDTMNNQIILTNFSQVYKNIKDKKDWNVMVIPTKFDFSVLEGVTLDLRSDNLFPGGGTKIAYEMMDTLVYNKFDYLSGKWSKISKDYNNFKDVFPVMGGLKPVQKNVFKDYLSLPKSKYENSLPNLSEHFVSQRLTDTFKLSDVLQFNVVGHLDRIPGDLFFIDASELSPAMNTRFTGAWILSRIHHKFTQGKFFQNISLSRSAKIPENVTLPTA